MRIEKEYDVQELANKVKEEIKSCRKCGTKRVSIDFITAQEIADVLETVASWENKRIKLRDIREKALKEALPKECCFGMYDDNIVCLCCDRKKECMNETEIEDDETEDFV